MSTWAPAACFSFISCSTWRSTLLLNPPASPRSDTTTTTSTFLTSSCFWSKAFSDPPTRSATFASISIMESEYGVAASTRSVARRILAAATISMVRVICFVDATELIRRSMS